MPSIIVRVPLSFKVYSALYGALWEPGNTLLLFKGRTGGLEGSLVGGFLGDLNPKKGKGGLLRVLASSCLGTFTCWEVWKRTAGKSCSLSSKP